MIRLLFIGLAVSLLAACAGTPQQPVALDGTAFSGESSRLGVLVRYPQESKLILPGASCLLCVAAAAAANSKLSSHVKTIPTTDRATLEQDSIATLQANGSQVVTLASELDISKLPKHKSELENSTKQDFSALAEQHNANDILVIDVAHLGVTRAYTSYVPTGPPQASSLGTAYLVNATDNTYRWYLPLNFSVGVEGEWKEPPAYPGVTNAYYQMLELMRDAILGPLTGKSPAATEPEAELSPTTTAE